MQMGFQDYELGIIWPDSGSTDSSIYCTAFLATSRAGFLHPPSCSTAAIGSDWKKKKSQDTVYEMSSWAIVQFIMNSDHFIMTRAGFQTAACVLASNDCQWRVASARVLHFLALSYTGLKHFVASVQASLLHLHTQEAPGVATPKSFPSPLSILYPVVTVHLLVLFPSSARLLAPKESVQGFYWCCNTYHKFHSSRPPFLSEA